MSPHSASSALNIHWNIPATISDKSQWYYQGQEPSSNWFAQPTHNAAISSAGLGSSSLASHGCPTSCPPLPTPTWGTCTTMQDEGSCCPSIACVGEPISFVPPELESNNDANNTVCADFIIPCPDECPETCSYPQDVLCPFQHQPVCPPKEVAAVANDSESREILEPVLTSTPSAHIETTTVTEYVQTSSTTVCPMIMYMW
ncbi:hypothetical protein O0I10_008556 [Lichtheimia ornata]|uniref:Uncharacterized protein n=1 Tax=Lichtheimia ornata TaxID=688661 RepID=A0AAD7XWR8_9FUNG|nr:uncharacterized protein O0I10_008556 [Lichtheimia ornata]KAJ8655671.1 hypothetical protein O0I10_008556 [Lichtheimia ornata]